MAATSVFSRTFSSVSLSHIPPNSPSLPFISRNFSHRKTSSRTCLPIRKHGALKVHSMTASFDSRLEDTVKKTVADNPVVVYSKTWCPYSSQVKSLFNQIGVQPLVVELDEIGAQGPQVQKVLEQLTGQHTVPNVFIGGKHIGGCTDTVNLHRKGELEALLADAKDT
ncbi:putative thioredoxin-disulfide reductase [Helianthus debilis subsp. tardiflorus]